MLILVGFRAESLIDISAAHHASTVFLFFTFFFFTFFAYLSTYISHVVDFYKEYSGVDAYFWLVGKYVE